MLRGIKILENHFITKEDQSSLKEENLLEKYRKMSDIDLDFLRSFLQKELNQDIIHKVNEIISNRRNFEPEIDEEDDRWTKRMKVNKRILIMLSEIKKAVPMRDLLTDITF